jgi:hypothetical protein
MRPLSRRCGSLLTILPDVPITLHCPDKAELRAGGQNRPAGLGRCEAKIVPLAKSITREVRRESRTHLLLTFHKRRLRDARTFL